MNLKQLGILIAIVVVVGGAGLVLHNRQQASWSGGSAEVGKKLLGEFPFNDVAHIEIRHGTNELNLVKKNDVWGVRERSDYPANFSQISEFLLKVRDLKIVQTEEIGPSQLGRMELAQGQGSNLAVVVEFKDQSDKPIRTLLLGKKHIKKPTTPAPAEGEDSSPDGRYVQVGTNSSSVALISDALDNMDTQPEPWLNKDFIHVEKPKSIEVDFPAETNSWKLTRETETSDWKLANSKAGEELDSSKTSGVTSPFSSPAFTDVLPLSKSTQLGTDKPTVIKIATFDNFNYEIQVGAKTNDDYRFVVGVTGEAPKERVAGKDEKPEDKARLDKEFKDAQQKSTDKLKQEQSYKQWTYLMPSWAVDPVLKERGQLFAEKKSEPKAASDTEKSIGTNQAPVMTPVPGL
jgi:hypothetical protein